MERIIEDLNLSKVTLGTMRFQEKKLTVNQVVSIIDEAYEIGISTHHSSAEYSSFCLYLKGLNKSKKRNKLKHIVKLSSPHFEEDVFSTKTLERRIDYQLKQLNIDCIDVLQWLVRSKPINDIDRLYILENQQEEIMNSLANLKKKGKIRTCFSFPYSLPFANKVLSLSEIDGLITYLNKKEIEYEKFANTKPFIAIRPFFAGQLLNKSNNVLEVEKEIISNLNFTMSHQKVITTIVGINSLENLKVYRNIL